MIETVALLKPEETGLASSLYAELSGGDTPSLSYRTGVKEDGLNLHRVIDPGSEKELIQAADFRGLLYQPESIHVPDPIYAIYRDIRPENLADEIEHRGLRYALAMLRDGTIRETEEWVRTRGHITAPAPGTNLRYPEVYEILFGNGLLYLQNGTGDWVNDTVVIPLSVGDKAVIAPGWASMVINVGARPLIIGAWCVNDAVPAETESGGTPMPGESEPSQLSGPAELLERGGMAHYVLRDTEGLPYYVANPKYTNVPMPRTILPKEMPDWGLSRATPLLTAFHENPDYFRFLLRPQDYETVWKALYDVTA